MQLFNGDCLEVMKTIADKSIDLIITDPPYAMNYQSNFRTEKFDKIKNDKNLDFLDNYFFNCERILKNNTNIYCFCSWHKIDIFKSLFEKYFDLKNILIWEKNNTSMGDLKGSYAPKYEMCLFGCKGRRELLGGFRYSDIIQCDRTGNIYHPTQKPIQILELFINNSSKKNEIVFDGFMGSGSTGVACVNTQRDFIGIELDKHYFDIASERIKNASAQGMFDFE